MPGKPMSYERRRRWNGYLFVAPWLVGALFFFLIPLGQSILYSVSELKLAPGGVDIKIVGFERYRYFFLEDIDGTTLLRDSLQEVGLQTLYVTILSVVVAVILNQRFRGRLFMRAVFFLPVIVTSGLVMSILRGDTTVQALVMEGGKTSTLVQSFQLQALLQQVLPMEILTRITGIVNNIFDFTWMSGVQILVLLAGLQTIPGTLKEAARIDGASGWEYFSFVTLPLLSPVLLLTVIYSVIDGLSDFGNDYQQKILLQATQSLNYSYSSALATIYLVVVLALVGLLFFLSRRLVFYMVD